MLEKDLFCQNLVRTSPYVRIRSTGPVGTYKTLKLFLIRAGGTYTDIRTGPDQVFDQEGLILFQADFLRHNTVQISRKYLSFS